jgi:hypothetical protein
MLLPDQPSGLTQGNSDEVPSKTRNLQKKLVTSNVQACFAQRWVRVLEDRTTCNDCAGTSARVPEIRDL